MRSFTGLLLISNARPSRRDVRTNRSRPDDLRCPEAFAIWSATPKDPSSPRSQACCRRLSPSCALRGARNVTPSPCEPFLERSMRVGLCFAARAKQSGAPRLCHRTLKRSHSYAVRTHWRWLGRGYDADEVLSTQAYSLQKSPCEIVYVHLKKAMP